MFYHHIKHVNRYRHWFSGQGKILEVLLKHKQLSQSKLLEIVDIKAPSLSEALSKMQKQLLITRKTSPSDSRENIISLTAKGKWQANYFRRMKQHHSDKMFNSLSEEEKEQLTVILEKLHMGEDDHMHVHFRGHHFGDHKGKHQPHEGKK
jgi:DNA-binding MarR family transcriptional regulator